MKLKASSESIDFRRKYNVISNEQRRTIIRAYNMGQTLRDISVNYDIGYYTARHVIRLYQKRRGLVTDLFKSRRRALDDAQIKTLWGWVDDDCTIKSFELAAMVEAKFGIKVSISTIDRYLKPFHYNIDMHYADLADIIPVKTVNIKKGYLLNKYSVCSKANVVFIDATTIQFSTRSTTNQNTRCYGRNLKRVRAKYYSLFCAFSQNALLYHSFKDHDDNRSKNPEAFIKGLLERMHLWGSSSIYFIMTKPIFQNDNFIQKAIAIRGHRLISMPFIDSFHNPMKKLFDEWKILVQQSEPKTAGELYQNAEMAFCSIQPKENSYYFSQIEKYIPLCV